MEKRRQSYPVFNVCFPAKAGWVANTRFSTHFSNHLTVRGLRFSATPSTPYSTIRLAVRHVSWCGTCLNAAQYMVFRVATRHVSQPERCLTATARLRAGASRAQTSLLDRSKTAISLAIWGAPGDADFSELSLHFIPPYPIVRRPNGLFVSQVGRSFPRSQRPFHAPAQRPDGTKCEKICEKSRWLLGHSGELHYLCGKIP